jgi:hypothetical protein
VQAFRDAGLEQRAPGRREAPALGGDADEGCGRREGERVVDRRDDRNAALRLPSPLRVEQRHDRPPAVREHAAARLAVVRIGGEPFGQDQQPLGLFP